MRFLILSVATLLLVGCAHHQPPPVWITQQQLALFTDRALTAMRTHESVRLPDGSTTPVVGDYDSSQPIRYTTRPQPSPTVIIHIPTGGTSSSASYTEFAFDAQSGIITRISYGTIHH